jgi:phthalate 4,5-dioxygenase
VWAYLGPPEARPPLPDLGYLAAGDDSRYAMKRWQDCHWLQALEVDIDSSHVAWLHREELLASPDDPKTRIILEQTAPAFEVAERDYGLLIGASRPDGDADYWRVNQWLMPWYTFIPAESDDEVLGVHAWIPVDDDHCWVWGLSWHPRRALTSAELDDWRAGRGGRFPELLPGGYHPRRNAGNQWEIDRPAQRSGRLWMGIEGNQEQDDAITASMGTAYDRSRERLVGTDLGVIATRRRLLACARDVAAGGEAPGAEGASYDVVPVSVHLPRGADWAAEVDAVISARVGTGPQVPA